MKKSNSTASVDKYFALHPNWFKVKIVPRRAQEGQPEKEFAYVSGLTCEQVRIETQESLGVGYFVTAKPIQYDEMIRQIEKSIDLGQRKFFQAQKHLTVV